MAVDDRPRPTPKDQAARAPSPQRMQFVPDPTGQTAGFWQAMNPDTGMTSITQSTMQQSPGATPALAPGARTDPSDPLGLNRGGAAGTPSDPPAATTTTPSGSVQGSGSNMTITGPAGPTTSAQPGAAWGTLVNPLAQNLYYAQNVQPMMQAIQAQMGADNAAFAQQAANDPMAKYMPPQFAALFSNERNRMGQQQNALNASMMNAVANAPAYDALMNQINAQRQKTAQLYEQALYSNASSGGAVNPFATAVPGGAGTTPSPVSPQQAVLNATPKTQ